MLEFKNVTKEFQTITAVNNVSFKIESGTVLGIVGRNGAGKSTIFRMILNLIEPTKGEILYNNQPITEKTLNNIGYLPEEGSLIPQYTVLDICEYYGSLKLLDNQTSFNNLMRWLKLFKIENYLNAKIKTLSKGNRQKIQFIVAILHNPEFVILDEPFSGLDPVSVEELEKAILMLKNEGKTIIFSSHIMSHVENLCDDLLLIDHGNTMLYGNLNEIKSTYQINGKKAESLNEIFIDKVGENDE